MSQEKSQRGAYDSIADLDNDPGLVGLALRTIPDWMKLEADRRDDPWKLLLGARDMSKAHRQLFIAAQSQRTAILRFSRKAQRTGSVKSSSYDDLLKAIKAGNQRAQSVAMKIIFAGMHKTDRAKFLLSAAKGRPLLQSKIKDWIAAAYQNEVRRLGRRKADSKPKRLTIADCTKSYFSGDRIGFTMTCGWMRGDKLGFPGFCFCSDTVIVQLLRNLLNLHTLEVATVRTMRQRLGLRKASVLVQKFNRSGEGFQLSDAKGRAIWRGSWKQ